MTKTAHREEEAMPDWLRKIMSLVCAAAGVLVLWATWFFYHSRIDNPDFAWYRWIQPAIMVIAGALCFGAAIGFLRGNRNNAGVHLLKMAASSIPVILALRLIIVIVLFLGKGLEWLKSGASFEGFSFGRSGLWITAAVLAIIIITKLLSRKDTRKDNDGEG